MLLVANPLRLSPGTLSVLRTCRIEATIDVLERLTAAQLRAPPSLGPIHLAEIEDRLAE